MEEKYEIKIVTKKNLNECCPDCQPNQRRCYPDCKRSNHAAKNSSVKGSNFCQPECFPNYEEEIYGK